jgi:excisionase family DNA binding protein
MQTSSAHSKIPTQRPPGRAVSGRNASPTNAAWSEVAWPPRPALQPTAAPHYADIVRYLSVTTIADALAVCPETIYRAIAHGELAAIRVKPTGPYRVAHAEYARYCEAAIKPLKIYRHSASNASPPSATYRLAFRP